MSKNAVLPVPNKPEETTALDLSTIFCPTKKSVLNPIDEYYETSQELLRRAADSKVASDEILVRLLLLDLVSSAEVYFRRVLAGTLETCPHVRRVAQRRMLPLGAVGYYGSTELGYALLENASFSTQGEIKRQTNNLTGFDIKGGSSLAAAIADFEVVCQLRHALIHARGEAGAQNIMELSLELDTPCRVVLTTFAFQSLVLKTHNTVRAYNAFLFKAVLESWIAKKLLVDDWSRDKASFRSLFSLFVSKTDGLGPKNAWLAYCALRPALKS